jgi:[acyl-carrier-protein] S-malonyltransferase
MGRELAEKYPVARKAFEEAEAGLDFSISNLCFEGSQDDLQLTENTQPAILTTSVASFVCWQRRGFTPISSPVTAW